VFNPIKTLTFDVETTVVYRQGDPYKTAYGWIRPNVKAQCSLFTYRCNM